MTLRIVIFVTISLISISCKDELSDKNLLPKSTGGIREMVIVVDKSHEKSKTKYLADKIFQKRVDYILQDEPIFNVLYISKESFASNKLIKNFRNILYINKGTRDTIFFKRDIFSKPQLAVFVNGKDTVSTKKILYKNRDKILNIFIKNDNDYLKELNKNNKWDNPYFLEKSDFTLDVPKDYMVSLMKDDFVWLTKDLKNGYYNVMFYQLDYDQDIKEHDILDSRNLYTEKYIHGTLKNSYVSVEKKVPPIIEYKEVDGLFTIKTTGMWKMENDFMGGYFINYAIIDELKKKIYCLDGFVYLPNSKKNPGLVEVESILDSFKKK